MLKHKELANSKKASRRRARILITDGNRMFADGLRTMLMIRKKLGVPVVSVSAEETLIQLRDHEFDLLITDIKLPGISGVELTQKVKALYPDMKVLVLSMHEDHDVTESFFRLKPDGYLLKTSDPDDFFRAIDYLLE
jgi:DNA-binding NarL/FixJ family response regulator